MIRLHTNVPVNLSELSERQRWFMEQKGKVRKMDASDIIEGEKEGQFTDFLAMPANNCYGAEAT